MNGQTYGHTNIWTDRNTEIQIHGWTDIRTDRRTMPGLLTDGLTCFLKEAVLMYAEQCSADGLILSAYTAYTSLFTDDSSQLTGLH